MSKDRSGDPDCLRRLVLQTDDVSDRLRDEVARLRKFIQGIADAPDMLVSRLTRDEAKEVLDV